MGQDLQLSVAIAQCASVVGDVQDNLRRAELLCQDARKQRAELILFPECHATGYSYRDLSWLVRRCAEPVDGPIAQRLIAMATRFSLVICCGTIERARGRFYNTHLVAFPDGRLERQRKGELNELEQTIFSAEPPRQAFHWKGIRFGILVCADLAMTSYRGEFRKLGIGLVCNPSAGRIDGDTAEIDPMVPVRSGQRLARKLNAACAVANPCGFSGEDYYPGNSWIMDRQGKTLALLPTITNPNKMRDSIAVATVGFNR
jgi:predicted amidohydrolase